MEISPVDKLSCENGPKMAKNWTHPAAESHKKGQKFNSLSWSQFLSDFYNFLKKQNLNYLETGTEGIFKISQFLAELFKIKVVRRSWDTLYTATSKILRR